METEVTPLTTFETATKRAISAQDAPSAALPSAGDHEHASH
jgi:hypothetical protein